MDKHKHYAFSYASKATYTEVMSKLITGFVLALELAIASGAASALPGSPVIARSAAGGQIENWVMHLYLGERLFDDRVHLERAPDGALSGTLTVPDRFTVPLRHIVRNAEVISFDIEADEGDGPFHVKYEGRMYPTGDTYVGFATVTDDNSLLGGFVAQKLSPLATAALGNSQR